MDQVVLPRSFLFYLAHRPRLPTANVWSVSHLLRPIEGLVEAIYSGQGALNSRYIISYSDGEKTISGISHLHIVDESSLACKPECRSRQFRR